MSWCHSRRNTDSYNSAAHTVNFVLTRTGRTLSMTISDLHALPGDWL